MWMAWRTQKIQSFFSSRPVWELKPRALCGFTMDPKCSRTDWLKGSVSNFARSSSGMRQWHMELLLGITNKYHSDSVFWWTSGTFFAPIGNWDPFCDLSAAYIACVLMLVLAFHLFIQVYLFSLGGGEVLTTPTGSDSCFPDQNEFGFKFYDI